jgi:predicted exporter
MPWASVSAKRSSSVLQHALDMQAALAQLGVGRAHLGLTSGSTSWKNNGWHAEFVAVAQRAADDPPQHVAAALVAGQHAVDDQEAAARMWSAITRSDGGAQVGAVAVAAAAAAIRRRNRSMS